MPADSLRHSSALAVALAIVFLLITAGITFFKLFNGSITSPRMLPNITDVSSIWNLFTAVPVLVTAFVCHYNGKLPYCLKFSFANASDDNFINSPHFNGIREINK